MATKLYNGFSSHEYDVNKTFGISDVELVKLDILSHLFTHKGDRLMMPTFGSRLPDLAFEPLDGATISIIEEDIRTVIGFDPRVSLTRLDVTPDYDNNSVVAQVELYYIELNMYGNMDINIVTAQT